MIFRGFDMRKFLGKIICLALILSVLVSVFSVIGLAVSYDTGKSDADTEAELPSAEPTAANSTTKGYINSGIVMKVGSSFMLSYGSRTPIFEDGSGEPFGKPIKLDGTVYVPLAVASGYATPSCAPQPLDNGLSFKLSTAVGNVILTVLKDTAATPSGEVRLSAPVIYGTSEHSVDCYPLIALDDVSLLFPDIKIFYDPMGLIIFTKTAIELDRNSSTDLSYMLELMRKFVFDFITGENFYDRVKKNTDDFSHPYIYANQEQFDFINDIYKGEKTDETYRGWIDTIIKSVDGLYSKFTTLPDKPAITADPNDFDFTKKPDYYEHLAFEITNPLDNGIQDGEWIKNLDFDYGQFPVVKNGLSEQPLGYRGKHWNGGYEYSSGRCDDSASYAENIRMLALGYQITRDEKYAVLAYELTLSLMKWDHWAQGHFLNCASTAEAIGCTYDWLYNIWVELGYDTNAVAQAIYEKCVFYGYIVSLDLATHEYCEYFDEDVIPETNSYGTTEYNRLSINWNAVCTSGLVTGMLAIIGAEDKAGNDKLIGTKIDFTTTKGHGIIQGGKDPVNNSAHTHYEGMNILYWLIESNLYTLALRGLAQYAPDGSFIEGPGYWSYATNNLTEMLWAIDTAVGDDLGWHEFWGIDMTYYFAVNIEYPAHTRASGFQYWNFHDCSPSVMSTSMFFYAAQMLDDPALAAIRIDHLNAGKGLSIFDILGYKEDYLSLNLDDYALSKDYTMLSCNGAVSRSAWENGCIFVGMMGNKNGDTAHGQVDSGNFTYASLGYTWFVDLGSDNYDVYKYFSNSANLSYNQRHYYYRNGAEGANTVAITSRPDDIPYGQAWSGGGYLVHDKQASSENGSVTILESTSVFGSYASSYKRGMLFTNDRTTAVIQDELTFKSAESIAWIAHTEVSAKNIKISADGKTAILQHQIDSNMRYLRASIVTDGPSTLKFEVMTPGLNKDGSDFLLEKTHRPGWSLSMGGEDETSRKKYSRLVIKAENVTSFNCAVVIEEVSDIADPTPVGYSWDDMMTWDVNKVYKTTQPEAPAPSEEDEITLDDLVTYTKEAVKLFEGKYAFVNRTAQFFKTLCSAYAVLEKYPPESFANRDVFNRAYADYLKMMKVYDTYLDFANGTGSIISETMKGLIGIKPPKQLSQSVPQSEGSSESGNTESNGGGEAGSGTSAQ